MEIKIWRITAGLAASAVMAAAASTQVMAQHSPLADGPGKSELLNACVSCHDAGTIIAQKRTSDGWAQEVHKMMDFGVSVSDDQYKAITAYLDANYGKADAGAAPTTAEPSAPAASDAPPAADH